MSRLVLVEQASSPSTPATGRVELYYKTDGFWYYKDDNGTEYRLVAAGTTSSAAIVSTNRNLSVRTHASNPNYQLTVTADEVMLKNTGGDAMVASTVSETVDITVSGAGGLDTGSEAGNTWYYVYVIAKADGTVDGLLSTSSTSPTMPSGYTFKALVGVVRNNGASNFVAFRQGGNVVCYVGYQQALSGGTSTSEANISTSTLVPPIATAVQVQLEHTMTTGGAAQSTAALKIVTGNNVITAHPYSGFSSDTVIDSNSGWLYNEGQNIIYQISNGGAVSTVSLNVWVLSFNLPIG